MIEPEHTKVPLNIYRRRNVRSCPTRQSQTPAFCLAHFIPLFLNTATLHESM